jgi:hypothetical protein
MMRLMLIGELVGTKRRLSLHWATIPRWRRISCYYRITFLLGWSEKRSICKHDMGIYGRSEEMGSKKMSLTCCQLVAAVGRQEGKPDRVDSVRNLIVVYNDNFVAHVRVD